MVSIHRRFWTKVDIRSTSECWLWQGGTSKWGYGMFRIGDKMCTASRVAYQLCIGPIPYGAIVRHTCHKPLCVNPSHLLHGTWKDNTDDMCRAGRNDYGHGGRPLIPDDQRKLIKHEPGKLREVAAKYNVSITSVWKIRREQ